MRRSPLHTLLPFAALILSACGRHASDGATDAPTASAMATSAAVAPTVDTPTARLRLDGEIWQADREIFALLTPMGADRRLIMGGSLGPKDASEQTFNLNLNGVTGPGTYVVRASAGLDSAIQLANWKPERYLIGGTLGADVTVRIETLVESPLTVVATFSGTMTANDGTTMHVTDGEFRYSE